MPPKRQPTDATAFRDTKKAAKSSHMSTNSVTPPKYLCTYPYCQHHQQPFLRPQDYLRHLTTNQCIAKTAQLRCLDQLLDNQKLQSRLQWIFPTTHPNCLGRIAVYSH